MSSWGVAWGDSWGWSWGPLYEVEIAPKKKKETPSVSGSGKMHLAELYANKDIKETKEKLLQQDEELLVILTNMINAGIII